MKIHILINALDYGDAVSTHSILLKNRAHDIGIEAFLYAAFSDDRVRGHVTSLDELAANASVDDVLLHQLFNDTTLMPYVEAFPGRRVMMYHNITPPEYFPKGSPVYRSCAGGLRLVQSLTGLYHHAVGMSQFSRQDLDRMGYPSTDVFPLFVDIDRLQSILPDASLMNRRWTSGRTFLFVGRVAPNKCIGDLLRFLAAYQRTGAPARLVVVGDDRQHSHYTDELQQLAGRLNLHVGEDVVFTGKVSDSQLVAWYRTSDAFVCLSEHEGFGAPLLESMAFGLPTFAYAGGATEETLGGAGVLWLSKDFEALVDDARGVLADEARRMLLVASQKRRADVFAADAQRKALRALIESISEIGALSRVAPLVSVVINTYNRASHLERCLATLRKQIYRDFEVVVVNGPSTDRSLAILRRFDGQIRIAETSSRVLSVSRNVGIQTSSGELVAFIDDDAIADPRWLEELVKAFSDPRVGGAGGLVYRMNSRDIEFRNGILDVEGFVHWNEPSPGTHWGWQNGYLNTVSGNNCAFRRSALEKIGGFDERIEYYHDEADVVMRLQLAGFRTVHQPGAVVYHEGALSENRTGKYTLNWRVICKNTVYCALKNYTGSIPRARMARRIAFRLVRERMADIFHWWAARRIGTGAFLKMEFACLIGIAIGIRRGLDAHPLCREILPVPSDSGFIRYAEEQFHGFSICLLSQSLPDRSPGGIATYTLNLCNGLRKLGCSVHVISAGSEWNSELRDGIWFHTAASVPVQEQLVDAALYPTAAKNLSYSYGIRKKLLDIDARWGLDLIESPNWDVEGLLAALEHRTPVVVRAHSPMFMVAETQEWEMTDDLQLCSSLEGLLMRHADAVSGSTTALLTLIDERFGIAHKSFHVPLGLNLDKASAPVPTSHRRTILFVGRLERRKGIHTLLEAIPRVLLASDAADFEIVGPAGKGDLCETFEELWNKRAGNFKDRVHFHGEVSQDQLARFYDDCDIFVAPSLYESFGLVYLEAMARGKAVIGCRTGGVPEVVLDGRTGILVPPGDVGALADAILHLVNDGALAEQFGTAGLQRYRELFTLDAMASQSLDLYRSLSETWRSSADIIWRGSAMDLQREPSALVRWHPETQQVCLLIEEGDPRTPVFGPYIKLQEGSYRAEFKLWVESKPSKTVRLGSVEVFSMKIGTLGVRAFGSADLAAGPGCVLDVYFAVTDSSADDEYEFRLHTTGAASLYLRQIIVKRWPPRGFPHSTLAISDAQTTALEQSAP